jgi:energy-coupling factor transporter ATP-binding protein EcfA2
MTATSLAALEAGDTTFVNPQPSFFDELMRVQPANDNGPSAQPRIIALTGYAGSGKSTVASALVRLGYTHTKFAGPLKGMLRALYRSTDMPFAEIERRIEGDLKEIPDRLLNGRTPRQAMQWLGTEWGRGYFGDDFWVGMWAAGLRNGKRYVVDDCRFPNEADAIRSRGGVIVFIDRPGVGPVNDHVSERLPTTPDVTLTNDGSLQDLSEKVKQLAA